jgi:probable F420-dependent oxidoreductase
MDLGRIGIWSVGLRTLERADSIAAAEELENSGFGTIWIPGRKDGVFERAGELLAATSRIVVATGIVSIWDYAAKQIAVQHHALTKAYPGRFLLGLGVGHGHERTFAELSAYLDELDRVPDPVPANERVLAALGPRMLKVARDRFLGTHPYNVTVGNTRRARETLGPGVLLAPEQAVILETDAGRARQIARQFLSFYLQAPNYTNNFIRDGFKADDFLNGGSDRLIDALIAWGDPSAIRRRVSDHLSAGADHVAIQVVTAERNSLPIKEWSNLAAALASIR